MTQARHIRATLSRSDEGYGFELRSGVNVKGRLGWQLHAQARAIPVAAAQPRIDVLEIAGRLPAAETGVGLRSPQEHHLAFGPRWRVLQSRAIGAGEGLARLALPAEFAPEVESWVLHPALMDLATGWAMGLIAGYQPDHLWVPVSYTRIRVLRPLPAQIVSWVRNAADNRAGVSTASFDVTLATPEGEVCVEIEGFNIHRLDGGLTFTAPDARELSYDDAVAKPVSPAEERLLHAFSLGIQPAEGAEAFARAVAQAGSQIIVSSLNLPELIRQTAAAEAAKTEGKAFERPDLDTAYVEPRNDVERTLVGFWQDLLGVAQVGVEDSFFDLGGHSLIAVRLFAMVKKTYRVDFPISVLFEAPTIARCAALIIAQIGDVGGETPAKLAAPARRFTHLVPMHQGEGGAKQPFFLVAGMFGNVLNLRHLAQLLGGDRPFYGLQARGLYGDAAPHASLPEAAADYIAELRQVQPHGPYMLGGFLGWWADRMGDGAATGGCGRGGLAGGSAGHAFADAPRLAPRRQGVDQAGRVACQRPGLSGRMGAQALGMGAAEAPTASGGSGRCAVPQRRDRGGLSGRPAAVSDDHPARRDGAVPPAAGSALGGDGGQLGVSRRRNMCLPTTI